MLDRDKATAISEVVVDVVQDAKGEGADTVKRVRFNLADKRAALVDLGKHLGMFVDRKHVTLEHGDKTDDERACRPRRAIPRSALAAKLLRELQSRVARS